MMAMTTRQLLRFIELIPELKARESIDAATAAAYPHLTADAQRALMRGWRETARVPAFAGMKRVPAQAVAAWLAQRGRT